MRLWLVRAVMHRDETMGIYLRYRTLHILPTELGYSYGESGVLESGREEKGEATDSG